MSHGPGCEGPGCDESARKETKGEQKEDIRVQQGGTVGSSKGKGKSVRIIVTCGHDT